MWPSGMTIYALSFGIIPLAIVGRLVKINGRRELLRFRSLGAVTIWIGYHLTPWMAFLTGTQYHNFLLLQTMSIKASSSQLCVCWLF